jgi:hypothetical protein
MKMVNLSGAAERETCSRRETYHRQGRDSDKVSDVLVTLVGFDVVLQKERDQRAGGGDASQADA